MAANGHNNNSCTSQSGLHVAGSTNLSDMIGGVNKGLGYSYQYQTCFITNCHNTTKTKTTLTSETTMDTVYGSNGNSYRNNWRNIPNIQTQFATTQLAYHPLLAAGKNQPANTLNSNWNTSTLRRNDATSAGGPYNGLDNTFVDGWKATSLVTCSDCHDNSTATGARGPHGSNQPWVLKGMNRSITVNTAGSGIVTPNAQAPALYDPNFCVNCHRSDVYGWGKEGPNTNDELLSRIEHMGGGFSENCKDISYTGSEGGNRNIGCFNCHGGSEVGGIHGTSLSAQGSGNRALGTRFMNGNSRQGVLLQTTGQGTPQISCYVTPTPQPLNVTLSSCSHHNNGSSSKDFTYAY